LVEAFDGAIPEADLADGRADGDFAIADMSGIGGIAFIEGGNANLLAPGVLAQHLGLRPFLAACLTGARF